MQKYDDIEKFIFNCQLNIHTLHNEVYFEILNERVWFVSKPDLFNIRLRHYESMYMKHDLFLMSHLLYSVHLYSLDKNITGNFMETEDALRRMRTLYK
jgi:hypothetical protein